MARPPIGLVGRPGFTPFEACLQLWTGNLASSLQMVTKWDQHLRRLSNTFAPHHFRHVMLGCLVKMVMVLLTQSWCWLPRIPIFSVW